MARFKRKRNHCNSNAALGLVAEEVGFEFTDYMITKEFCGATRPSKVLKGMGGNF
jgi:hypothetical protein